MSTEFNFLVVDANQVVEKQQVVVRELVSRRLDLASFHRAERPSAKPPAEPYKKAKVEEPVQ
jgi:uncharacterized coiled-coil protein SlyX